MINAEIKDLKLFVEFLGIASRFVQQGELVIFKDKTALYAKNLQDFLMSRLILETNSMILDFKYKYDYIKFCLKDLTALRSALNIILQVENINSCILELDDLPPMEFIDIKKDPATGNDIQTKRIEYFAKSLRYTGVAKFKLIAVDNKVIDNFISKGLSHEITEDFSCIVNPVNLDILQNKTNSIVDVTKDVYVYLLIDPDTNKVVIDLNTRETDYTNSISLPIADTYVGAIPYELKLHESAFRIFNLLRVKENLKLIFSSAHKAIILKSEINHDNFYIKSILLNGIIKVK